MWTLPNIKIGIWWIYFGRGCFFLDLPLQWKAWLKATSKVSPPVAENCWSLTLRVETICIKALAENKNLELVDLENKFSKPEKFPML